MVRKVAIIVAVVCTCLFGVGGVAEDKPEKRVMNFIAVMNLKCEEGIKKNQCTLLTDIVIEELVKIGKYKVIDRANRDKILGEIGFQQTGCVEGSCTVEAGRILGVGKIVVGSITKLGETYFVTLQIVNVETATVELAEKTKCKNCKLDDLADTVTNTARKLMGEKPVSTRTQPPAVAGGEMVLVPAGEFWMGCNKSLDKRCSKNQKPYHKVYLDAFYIDKYEYPNQKGEKPRTEVSWQEAQRLCKARGKRLPTEAEWEKAARGTDGRTYPWGEGIDCSKANYYKCKRRGTVPVGSYPPGASPYGAMDMAGNVNEWTADMYDKNYYRNSPNRNPKGPSSGNARVVRGGSRDFNPSYLRASNRHYHDPSYGYRDNGLRCARTP